MEFEGNSQTSVASMYNTETKGERELHILTSQQLTIVENFNFLILGGIICVLGIIANIINITVFASQGLNTTMNISFFALAISDTCGLVTLEWLNICLSPFMEAADIPFDPVDVEYLTGGWPHTCFATITCWITAFATAERCCCIAVPLKVKQIFTPTRARVVIWSIYLFMFLALTPEYLTLYFGEKFFPERNETRIGLVPNDKYKDKLQGFTFLEYAIISIFSFFAVILFTAVLVSTMKQNADWRRKSTSDPGQSTKRDRKAIKMVSLIAGLLITCYTPSFLLNVTVFFEPEFGLEGIYRDIFIFTWSIAFLCEAVNASINIFLYYIMSSKYRETFHMLFGRCWKH